MYTFIYIYSASLSTAGKCRYAKTSRRINFAMRNIKLGFAESKTFSHLQKVAFFSIRDDASE